jgi:glycosyltransferase involved in cell wall biosynthesis
VGPLLTFAVLGWNQETFVREAIEAAFSQTYSPLEIILSDDYSSDRTFEIMREMAATYRGCHRVRLNRNPGRCYLGGHVNKVVELARGALIVVQAGDDVSLPERAETIFRTWDRGGREATSVHSDFVQIDKNGDVVEKVFNPRNRGVRNGLTPQLVAPSEFVRTARPAVFGCTQAFSKRLFEIFGNVPEGIVHEDDVLAFRSVLLGGLAYLDAPLVRYRVHGGNLFIGTTVDFSDPKRAAGQAKRLVMDRAATYEAFGVDLRHARECNLVDGVEFRRTMREIERMRRYHSLVRKYLECGAPSAIWNYLKLRRSGVDKYQDLVVRILVRRFIPRSVYVWIKALRSRKSEQGHDERLRHDLSA